MGDVESTSRFYESALYGEWPGNGGDERSLLRLEYIGFLQSQGEQGRALAQVLALSANIPSNVESHLQVARLFLSTGDPRRALEHFERAGQIEPDRPEPRIGAGRAAFAMNDYPRATAWLAGATDADDVRIREVATQVQANDPLAPGLPLGERRRRLLGGLRHAETTSEACKGTLAQRGEPSPRLDSLEMEVALLTPQLEMRRLRDAPETIDRGVRTVVDLLAETGRACPPATPLDEAWRRLARQHGVGG
jgi:tetratricopeptide (TPR) repeat protein